MVTVHGLVFTRRGVVGDFAWMIDCEEYQDSLFIFNDNEECHRSCRRGGGNAVIRTYNKYNKALTRPHSCGIPTGTQRSGGYPALTAEAKRVIDESVEEIKVVIRDHGYQRVFYSADATGKLGTSIFAVGPEVVDYITDLIRGLAVP